MPPESYSEPVAQLLRLGEPPDFGSPWRNYPALGLTETHVPELIRMAMDVSLHDAPEDSTRVWAPVHAWRTLGQMRAVSAIEPLIELLYRLDEDDDWAGEELPIVLGLIGPTAITPLIAALNDAGRGEWERVAVASSLSEIGRKHPQARGGCVAIINRRLERYADSTDEFNAFLIASLLDLNAMEAAPAIQQAFMSNAVDLDVVGDWDDVKVQLFAPKAGGDKK